MLVRRRLRRAGRALGAGALALSAVGLLAATGAAAPVEPALQRETLPGNAEITYTVVDPVQVDIDAAAAGDGTPQCFAGGARGNGCQATIGELVRSRNGALGVTANYSDGTHILGLAVVDHRLLAPANPHTTALCVGDPAAPGQRPPVSITKTADATVCRTAVSGERVVAAGVPAIEGLADDGLAGHFWWSVEHLRRVERTLVGLRADGTVVVAVATSARQGVRGGMTVAAAATWLIAHGVTDAIALDGGHQADLYSAEHGSQVPVERGEPRLQMALLLGSVLPPPAPPTPAGPAPLPAAPAAPAVAATPLSRVHPRVDGVELGTAGAGAVLDVIPGAPARPQTGTPQGSGFVVEGSEPVELDSRWLAAARAGHPLPDLDVAPAPPAMPETGAASVGGG